jgi:dual specificity protein kinase YAK1
MDQQWSPYTDAAAANRQPRYAPHSMTTPQHLQRDPNGAHQIKQDPYTSPSAPSRTSSMPLSPGTQSGRGADYNDGDGDVRMEDADPYNKPKQGSARAAQQQRQSQQFIQQEESAAARRYSPMNLSPTSPYNNGSAQQGGQAYTSFSPQGQSTRQSPTRGNNPYISPPNSYYSPPSKSHSRPHPARLSAGILIAGLYSLTAPRPATSPFAIDNDTGELLSAVRDRTAQCRIQSGCSVAPISES